MSEQVATLFVVAVVVVNALALVGYGVWRVVRWLRGRMK